MSKWCTSESKANTTKDSITYISGGGTHSTVAVNKNDDTKNYGIYKINVIKGEIKLTKQLATSSTEDRQFTFTLKKYDTDYPVTDYPVLWDATLKAYRPGTADEITNGTATSTITVTVSANKSSGEIAIKNLPRGNYKLSENDQTDYAIENVVIGDTTNCWSNNKNITGDTVTFTMGTVKISGADGATLTYVQIVEPDRGSEDGWKIVPGFEKAFTDAGLTIKDLLQNTPDTNAAQGKITTFNGLDAQDTTYYIVETQAPSGYKIDGIEHHLSGATANEPTTNTVKDSATKITTITTTYSFTDFGESGITTITNTKLSALPSTGGIGTTIFTIAGCVIMIAAAGLFFASRKKSDNK